MSFLLVAEMDPVAGCQRNNVKDKLSRDKPVYSVTVQLVRSIVIASIARTVGFDSIYIDLERSGISLDAAAQICVACLGLGIARFVPVPSVEPHFVGCMPSASGTIAPHLRSAEDAKVIVRAAKYPTLKKRSLAGMLLQLHSRTFLAAELNDTTMVVTMFECAEALAAFDEIAVVPGIDILFIGTNDLCSSLGIPSEPDHELVRDGYRRAFAAYRTHNKTLGIGGLASRPDLTKHFVTLRARYVPMGTDLSFLAGASRQKREQGAL